ncbi:MAG TPA: methyltransferase domain-containing protein [Candidatus Izemoplasmatales bacterium]|nr:methyltransferase domain-containing protein [Candidatus Izemoplasmatales bacterium]
MSTSKKRICRLCQNEMSYFATTRKRHYYRCPLCDSIQMDQAFILSLNDEKERYDNHNNDIHDIAYQQFVSPITHYVTHRFNKENLGLDFGAGPGPVISKLLEEQNYDIVKYDPHYHPNAFLLDRVYDYIIACEVIEHFNEPQQTFNLLNKMTNIQTEWIFMTVLYDDTIDFTHWYYKNDETHVIFYTEKTIHYLKEIYGWKKVHINNRLIVFSNK